MSTRSCQRFFRTRQGFGKSKSKLHHYFLYWIGIHHLKDAFPIGKGEFPASYVIVYRGHSTTNPNFITIFRGVLPLNIPIHLPLDFTQNVLFHFMTPSQLPFSGWVLVGNEGPSTFTLVYLGFSNLHSLLH